MLSPDPGIVLSSFYIAAMVLQPILAEPTAASRGKAPF